MKIEKQINRLFGGRIREAVERAAPDYQMLQEIRMRTGLPILFRYGKGDLYLEETGRLTYEPEHAVKPTGKEVQGIVEAACGYSGYAFEEEIRKGYITIGGGHRIGVAGQAVLKDGKIQTLKNISSLNIRVAHQVPGCAESWRACFYENNRPCHMLIIAPPGCGKTTVLREIIRIYSEGSKEYPPITVGVADERSEIGGAFRGDRTFDLGRNTDVMDACPKAFGMEMLLRSMAPQVLAADEIGSGDVESVESALRYGCRVVLTLHGDSLEDFLEKQSFERLAGEQIFERYLFLKGKDKPGQIARIYDKNFRILREDEG